MASAFMTGVTGGLDRRLASRGRRSDLHRCASGRGWARWRMTSGGGVLVAFGGSEVGVHAVRELQERGEKVVGLVSEEADLKLSKNLDVPVHVANTKDRDRVFELLASIRPDRVITCIGLAFEEEQNRTHYLGIVNLVDAAVSSSVERFVLLSTLGAGDSESAVPAQVRETLRPMLMDKSRSELYLRESGLEYTIVRPGPLESEDGHNVVLTEATSNCYGPISVKGLAGLLVKCLHSNKSPNCTFTAVDTDRLLHVRPYVRPREFWEPIPFDIFDV